MASFVRAEVVEVLGERNGLQKLRVRRLDGGAGDRAYALTQLVGAVAAGDEVIVNTTAVERNLGTGGWHFVHWNLARDELQTPSNGHQMKLRYTSLQFDTATAEERPGFKSPDSLDGTPVVCCELLSQAAVAAVAYKSVRPKARLVLVMTHDNALPMAFSDLVADLVDAGIVDATVTAGQAFGGDHEAVTTLSALAVAKATEHADVIVVTQGPGSLGTGSRFGFSTLGIAAVLDDVDWYGGRGVLAVRWSDADPRPRHKGLSHHTRTILDRTRAATVAVPATHADMEVDGHPVSAVDASSTKTLLEEASIAVTTMGRTYDDDPAFFDFAAAAGLVAAHIAMPSS